MIGERRALVVVNVDDAILQPMPLEERAAHLACDAIVRGVDDVVARLGESDPAAFGTLAPYAIQYGLALSPKWVAPLMAAYLIAHVIGYVCKATHTNAPACVLPHARAARLSDTTVRHILSRGSIPMWVALARRYGKVPAFLASIRLYVVLNLLFVPAAHPHLSPSASLFNLFWTRHTVVSS